MKAVILASTLLVLLASSPVLAECDTAPPTFTAFSFTPSSVNTTASSQNVTCTMTVTDPLSGADSVGCTFYSPSFAKVVSCAATTPSSGTPQNGTFSCVVTLPRYAEAGSWAAALSADDVVGNSRSLNSVFDPLNWPPGFPTTLTVTSDPDTVPPALTTLTLNPTSINTSSASQNVTCSMAVTDAKSGVSSATCVLYGPTGPGQQTRSCAATAPSSGTRNNGTFTCQATFPRYSDAGSWDAQVFLQDGAGNFAQLDPANTLTVTSVPEDVTPPSQTGFSFTPGAVSVGASAKSVTCTMTVTDATAGVDIASCEFSYEDTSTFTTYTQSCISTTPSSGTRNNGTFTCNVIIPRYSPGGAWLPTTTYIDLVGNGSSFEPAGALSVDCGGSADAETTVRFDNKTNLVWTAVAGASRYNVYRGLQTGLVDANLDHRPDGGYGTCQNTRDPNLTDLLFVDTDVPNATQKGFHYLVSYMAGGVEKGLGANSFGDPRTVTSPCP